MALAERAATAESQAHSARAAASAAKADAEAALGRAEFAGAERDALHSELGELRAQARTRGSRRSRV